MTSYEDLAQMLEALPLICRETRRRKQMSLRAAASTIGISFSTLCRFEGARMLSFQTPSQSSGGRRRE